MSARIRSFALLVVALIGALHAQTTAPTTSPVAVKIGVVAYRGVEDAQRSWQPTEGEKSRYPEVRPMASNPWTVIHGEAPAKPQVKPRGKRWASASGLVSCSVSCSVLFIAPKDRARVSCARPPRRARPQPRGRVRVNVAPPPSVAEWLKLPPWAVAIDAAMARPNPDPPRSRVRPVSAR